MSGGVRQALLIFTLFAIAGGNWCALQGFAWMTMLASDLRAESIGQAVTHTFDGRHPCPLCKAIAAGKKSERKTEWTGPPTRLEFPPPPRQFVWITPQRFGPRSPADGFAQTLRRQPPTPPPRLLGA